MSKDIAHVFRVEDLVFAVVQIDKLTKIFLSQTNVAFGLFGFNELPSLVG